MRNIFVKNPLLIPALILTAIILLFDFFNIEIPFHSSRLSKYIGRDIVAVGVVEECEKIEDINRLIVEIEGISFLQNKISERTIIYAKDEYPLGTSIKIRGRLELPNENTNDHLFNYRRYLRCLDIYTIINDAKIDKISYEPKLRHILKTRFRRVVEETFNTYTKEDNSKLLSTVFLADYDYIEDDLREDYQRYGIIHLLSVSGLHITIISTLIIYILAIFRIKRPITAPILFILIFIYASLLDYKSPVVRALIMAMVAQSAMIFKEPNSPLNNLSLAYLIILLFNPYELFNVGFQLSFLAMLSIIIFPKKKPSENFTFGSIIDAIYIVFICQLGTLPVILANYNYFNPLTFIANLLITPVFTLILWGGILLFPLSYIPNIAVVMGRGLDILLIFVKYTITLLDHLPDFAKNFKQPNFFQVLLYILILWFLFKGKDLILFYGEELCFNKIRSHNKSLYKIIFSVLIVLLIINTYAFFTKEKAMTIEMLDVGQGDSIFINVGEINILLDTGGSIFNGERIPKRITLPILQKKGIDKIDIFILSHYDADHSSGVDVICEYFDVGFFLLPYPSETEVYQRILKKNIPIVYSKIGLNITLDDYSQIQILYPKGTKPKEEGNKSLIFSLNHKGHCILFTGDSEKEDELRALKNISEVDVLKVAHHGSTTSTTEQFLSKANPRLALISAGIDNPYGHPSREVLERLEEHDIKILRTDKQGQIILKINERGISYSDFYMRKALRRREMIREIFYSIIGTLIIGAMSYFTYYEEPN